MSGPVEKVSALAGRLRAAGATIVRDDDGNASVVLRVGDNRKRAASSAAASQEIGANSAGQLKAFLERVERLEEERRTISDDIKDVYSEAKSNGFDPKILRQIVRIRKDPDQYREESEILETYLHALGMV
jgi:uncharacterized protein (UPF0335 family)